MQSSYFEMRELHRLCAVESVHFVHTGAIAGRLSRNVNGTRANISVLFFFCSPDNCVWREAFSIHRETGRNTVCWKKMGITYFASASE